MAKNKPPPVDNPPSGFQAQRAQATAAVAAWRAPASEIPVAEIKLEAEARGEARGVRAKNARGGKASGIVRAKKAEETWRSQAIELAIDARKRMPHGSRDDIADDVHPKLKARKSRPKVSTLEKFIDRAIAEGKIPPKAEK
jgi:hypothetical protein